MVGLVTSRMHDLIHDMGKYVVNMQKILNVAVWRIEDLEEVMIHNMGAKAMEAIWIRCPPKPIL